MKPVLEKEILIKINHSLLKMKKSEKIDLDILTSLSNLRNLLKNIKSKWLKIENSDGFYFYESATSLELVLDQIEYRFKNSQFSNDTEIVEDSLSILPAIVNVLEAIQLYEINEDSINKVLRRTRVLDIQAYDTNLIEPLDITIKHIDMNNVKRMLKAIKTQKI